MTQKVQVKAERPTSFRAVVEGVDRHGVRIADEFQAVGYATARPGLTLKTGMVVELSRSGKQDEVQRVLADYQPADYVKHPTVPGLRGKPLADMGHPGMFSVRGRTYLRSGEVVQPQVQSWVFDSADAEADYLRTVLKDDAELPGVRLSKATLDRLAGLGVATGDLERIAAEQRRIEKLWWTLKQETATALQSQQTVQAELIDLTSKRDQAEAEAQKFSEAAQKADDELDVLLQGIEEAKEEQERVQAQVKQLLEDAKNERQRLITEAQDDAKKIRSTANSLKVKAENDAKAILDKANAAAAKLTGEAEAATTAALTQAREVTKRAEDIHRVLARQEDHGAARQEIIGRKPYEALDEIPALQSALQNLQQARGTTPEQLVALHVGLKHTPFTVLAGPSGSGKTSLLLAYAQQMGIHITTVAVQPGWTSVQDLHGYVNPLRPGEYRSTPFFEALGYQVRQSQAVKLRELLRGVAADALPEQPGLIPLDLVLLDEINLSHVEYFLADYLSAFELDSRNVAVATPEEALRLALAGGSEPDDTHPLAWLRHLGGQLDVPRSFLIAGTANEDDTTRGFSDKFRDRSAFLHVEAPTLEATTLKRPKEVKEGKRYVPQQTWETWLGSGATADMSRELIEFSERLRAARLPVSVRLFQRTARMSGDARRLLEALGVQHAPRVALDLAVSLGIAHKYAQLTEGRSPEAQQKRKDLREALQKLLAGRQQTTFASLGWRLEE